MSEHQHRSRTKSFILGSIVGAAVGTLIGLLYAPKKGEEIRRELVRKGEKFKGKARKVLKEAQRTAGELSLTAQKGAEEFTQVMQETAGEVSAEIGEKIAEYQGKFAVDEGLSRPKSRVSRERKPRFFKGIKK